MSSLDDRELAQLGLKYIEDSIVDVLTRHPGGMATDQIADVLGLSAGLEPERRMMIAAGILELLARSGRILWDEQDGVYKDNPEMS